MGKEEFDNLCKAVDRLLTGRRVGLLTDMDGTISRISPTPGEATVSTLCRQYLGDLAENGILVAIISGRTAKETQRMVDIDRAIYYGNHGLERLEKTTLYHAPELEHFPSLIQKTLCRLKKRLVIPGIIVEDKKYSIGIHYRLASDENHARDTILAAIKGIAELESFQIQEGKLVVEIRPELAITKGSAVRELVHQYGLEVVFFLGDDITDVDAINALSDLRGNDRCEGLSIAVLGKDSPEILEKSADFTLNGVNGVEDFLHWLSASVAKKGV